MHFREIKSFQQVAYHKSFSKAAKKMFFTQPTITFHILELEKKLGDKLFVRNNSRLELTPIGEIFLIYVDQIIALHDESIDVISNFKQGKLGTLKLALTGSTGYWLFPLLDNFRRSNNNVNIDIHVSFFDTIMDRIITRKAHFGFIKADAPNFSHPLLFSKVFAMDESILVFSANHRFSKLEKITLVDICEEALVAYGSKTSFWQQILVEFNKVGLNPKIYADAYDYQTVKLLLQTSYGVAFLPKICVNEELEKGILKTLPIKDCAPIHRHSILIYRKDMVFNPLYERFISILFAKAYSM